MFEKALIRNSIQSDMTSDLGLVAETLLFYRHVQWMLNQGNLSDVAKRIGLDNLFYLIDSGYVKATFLRDTPVVYTDNSTGIESHSFVYIKMGAKGTKRLPKDDELIADLITRAMDGQKPSRRQVRKFLDKIPFRELGGSKNNPSSINRDVYDDVSNDNFVNKAMRAVLQTRLPNWEIPENWRFKVIQTDKGLVADTNYNFQAINNEYHRSVPPSHSTISPAYLLCSLFDARAGIFLAADYVSEIVTDPSSSSVINIKVADVLRRRSQSAREIEAFQALTLNDGRAVREAINSGQRSFSDFLSVLEQAEKFKEWLANANPDVGHLANYYQRVCEGTWVESLPAKVVRFCMFSAIGAGLSAIVPGLDAAVGAADTFFVDRLLKGWTPNQFINSQLRPFVGGSDRRGG